MPDFDDDKVTPFELDYTSFELFGHQPTLRNLAGITRLPEAGNVLRRGLAAHDFDNVRCRDRFGVWESFKERSSSEKVIAVAMGDVYGCEVLTASHDPLNQYVSLLDGEERINKDGVSLAVNQCRRCRHPC